MSEFDLSAQCEDDRKSPPGSSKIHDAWLRSCVQVLQADGASLLVNVDGHWHDLASSDRIAARINELQLLTGQGPGVQALLTGRPVQVPDWPHDARHWPLFAAGLGTEALGALFALPLTVGGDGSAADGVATIGVLHIYRATPGTLDVQQLNAVWLAAETVATTLTM